MVDLFGADDFCVREAAMDADGVTLIVSSCSWLSTRLVVGRVFIGMVGGREMMLVDTM